MKVRYIIALCGLSILASCKKTPNPNEILQNQSLVEYAPWDAPQYSYEDLLSFFPTTDYSNLTSFYVSTSGNDATGDGTSGKVLSH